MSLTSRLRPPEVDRSQALSWVLKAAFSKAEPAALAPELAPAVGELAPQLAVSERIAGRVPKDAWPAGIRQQLREQLNRSAATCLLYESLAHSLATIAAQRDVPLVFLKGFALYILEMQPPGSRPFSDLDILVPADAAHLLQNALLERGFKAIAEEPTEQHLGALRAPTGGVLEIHFALRGLRRRDGSAVVFDDLLRWRAVNRLRAFEGSVYGPSRDFLAAHLLVHALQQHLLRPTSYPLFRLVGDLIDLLPEATDWEAFEAEWEARYSSSIDRVDVRAVRELCWSLAAGDLPSEEDHGSSRLLSHLLAAAMNPDYAGTLATKYLTRRLRDALRHGELSAYLRRKLARSESSSQQSAGRWQQLTRGLRRHVGSLVSRFKP